MPGRAAEAVISGHNSPFRALDGIEVFDLRWNSVADGELESEIEVAVV